REERVAVPADRELPDLAVEQVCDDVLHRPRGRPRRARPVCGREAAQHGHQLHVEIGEEMGRVDRFDGTHVAHVITPLLPPPSAGGPKYNRGGAPEKSFPSISRTSPSHGAGRDSTPGSDGVSTTHFMSATGSSRRSSAGSRPRGSPTEASRTATPTAGSTPAEAGAAFT